MSDDRVLVALAGLLHDIGKFRQRALWDHPPRQRHEVHGANWVAEHIVPRLTFLENNDRERLVAAIRDHHGRPYDRDARALIVADRLASGERMSREDEERGHPAREPLRAILSTVHIEGNPEPGAKNAHATIPLPVDSQQWDTLFPRPAARAAVDYPALWQRFERACARLHPHVWQSPERALHALLALLRAYAWCVPAATFRSEPDVSLYDHLRVTAALAVCVSDHATDTIAAWEEHTRRGQFPNEPVALLVGGDLSGIQHFLYAVSAAGAAKALRGRSAYLSLVSDAAVAFLLRELALPPTQVLYSSGGHFYLLVPPSAELRIGELARHVTRTLVEAHGGNLALLLDAVPITGRDLRVAEQRLAERWAELIGRLGEQKLRRFRPLLESHYERIVGPFGGGGERRHCAVCYAEERRPTQPVQDERGVPKCSLCRSFEELGDTLARRPAFMAMAPAGDLSSRQLTWRSVLARLGVDLQFWAEEHPPRPHDDALIFRLNRADLDGRHLPVVGFRWLPAFTPLEEDGTLVELEAMATASRGAHLWACARADVDNLGLIFRAGLGARYSLSRVATLSHQFSLFFEGYINRLLAHVDPEGRHLYLIYSGGDDLLLVGSWDRVVAAIRRLRADFRRFTGHNPSLTLCGGITLHKSKYPLYQAAADAGRALEEAKQFRHPDGHVKDACTIFGVPMSWEDVEWVAAWQQELVSAIEAQGKARLSRAFLHRLARLAALPEEEAAILRSARYTQADLARLVAYHRARYHLVYTLARAPKAVRPTLERLRQELVEPPAGRFPLVRALTRWAELATRRERER